MSLSPTPIAPERPSSKPKPRDERLSMPFLLSQVPQEEHQQRPLFHYDEDIVATRPMPPALSHQRIGETLAKWEAWAIQEQEEREKEQERRQQDSRWTRIGVSIVHWTPPAPVRFAPSPEPPILKRHGNYRGLSQYASLAIEQIPQGGWDREWGRHHQQQQQPVQELSGLGGATGATGATASFQPPVHGAANYKNRPWEF
ncbi:hypothetical protein PGQ11_004128 [Apiospora arundinis]|uniref:Uncharacterized protein n=1 Tax=Apiospora arundinis TaxID=335852 RepID=A0ABR2J7F5_9PEZI